MDLGPVKIKKEYAEEFVKAYTISKENEKKESNININDYMADRKFIDEFMKKNN